eukprot:scaffold2917_cov191-Amphora_coffeaeformis.AAC.50
MTTPTTSSSPSNITSSTTSRILGKSSGSTSAILRGGGRHAAVVWEQIAPHYHQILVWMIPTMMMPCIRSCKSCCVIDPNLPNLGSPSLRQKLVTSVKNVFAADQAQDDTNKKDRVVFPSVVHATAVVSSTACIGQGCFIGPMALINTHARVGDFCLVNSAVLVEHDCILHDYATLNPGAMLMGGAFVGAMATLGANAVVRENRSVQDAAMVGMGAVVVRDINGPLHGFWAGVPAKPYLAPSLERGHLTNDGPLQTVLQSKVKNLVRSQSKVLLACSGTAALHALAAAHDLQQGRHVRWVTQAFTFPSSIQGPMSDALVCDIDPQWHGPCVEFLNKHKDEFDGIIVTNVFGHQTNMLDYEKWCTDNGKILIFDNAATPIGIIEDGRCIHDVGNGAFISFHETKPYGRGEGGAIFVAREIAPFVHQAMNFGYDIPKQIRIPNRESSNWRMSDFAAAAICDHIDSLLSNKAEEQLNELTRFAMEEVEKNGRKMALPVRYPTVLSCLFVDLGDDKVAEATCRRLNASGIEAKHYYTPLVERSEAPVAWQLFDRTICLPFHLGVSRTDLVDMIRMLSNL